MLRNLFCITIFFSLLLGVSASELVFESNFAGAADGTPLEKFGWTVKSSPGQSRYYIEKGKLRVECLPAQRLQGGYAEIDIPLCSKGVFEFDLLPDSSSANPGTCLFIDIYNISVFWHDYCQDWRRYFPEPVSRRMKYFDVEPVGHRRISPVEKGRACHYKIYFDKDGDRVEYYKGNMVDPAFIDGDVAVLGRSEYLGGKLRLGNWGIASGKVTFLIDNMKLTSLDGKDAAKAADAARTKILVFNGLSFNRYGIKEALCLNGTAPGDVKEFNIVNPRPALTAENSFVSDILPSAQTARETKCFVLVDYPFGPKEILPECVVKDMLENVYRGARLFIFGGLMSLEKGEYGKSAISAHLPVKLDSNQLFSKCDRPLPLTPAKPGMSGEFNWGAKPSVLYMHNLRLSNDAVVLMNAGDRPVLVSRRFGKGEITVFLGSTCGVGGQDFVAFWEWNDWRRFVASMIAK